MESQGSLQCHSWGTEPELHGCAREPLARTAVLGETDFSPVLLKCQQCGQGRCKRPQPEHSLGHSDSPTAPWEMAEPRCRLGSKCQQRRGGSGPALSAQRGNHVPQTAPLLWRGQLTSVYTPEGLGGRKLRTLDRCSPSWRWSGPSKL